MYFMDDKTLRNIERFMRGVPNFKPRGHGLVVICRFDYEPVDETLAELLLWTFQNVRNPIFRRRLERYIAECEDYDMRFKNEHHRRAFNDIIRKKDIKNKELISALYLLTADIKLNIIAKRCCDGNRISFRDMKLNGCSEEAYTLYCAAKDIYLKTKYLGLYDLSDADIIPFRTFGLICNAMVIRRFGIKAVQQEERNEKND